MYLVQLLLPLYDAQGNQLEGHLHQTVNAELVDRFGGVTAYTRSPADGRWLQEGKEVKDDIVIYEVMAERMETAWWAGYKLRLEERLSQQEIVIRSWKIQRH